MGNPPKIPPWALIIFRPISEIQGSKNDESWAPGSCSRDRWPRARWCSRTPRWSNPGHHQLADSRFCRMAWRSVGKNDPCRVCRSPARRERVKLRNDVVTGLPANKNAAHRARIPYRRLAPAAALLWEESAKSGRCPSRVWITARPAFRQTRAIAVGSSVPPTGRHRCSRRQVLRNLPFEKSRCMSMRRAHSAGRNS